LPANSEGRAMVIRNCIHCEAEIEVHSAAHAPCPICGLDLDLPPLATQFDDAPPFFLGGDPRRPAVADLVTVV
jgi:hypothetical protein